MYTKILIATDGSELSARGLKQGFALAKLVGAKVTVLTATEHWLPTVSAVGAIGAYDAFPEYDTAMEDAAKSALDAARSAAAAAGVAADFIHLPNSYPADAIISEAEKRGADLIVMSSHGRRGVGRLLLGSQTTEVLSRSKVPVLVVK